MERKGLAMTLFAFQGEAGAYSEAAGMQFFGSEALSLPCKSFEAVFDAVESGQAQAGMLPIENSLAGSIHQNYDLLLSHNLLIIGEHYLRVRHCLIGLPGVTLAEVRRVCSHPQALAQCDGYLHSLPDVEIEPVYDTAGAVKLVAAGGDRTTAAIASRHAAEVYAMQILAEGIEDNPANYTRFLAVAAQPVDAGPRPKTSVVFTLPNKPGALFKALSVFALRDLDLTKIESRPLAGSPWEYRFYVDFCGYETPEVALRALQHLAEFAPMLRVLGSYPRSGLDEPAGRR